MDKALRGLAIIATAIAVTSCGGGGGDDQYTGAAPLSLNGVTLNFEGALLTFTAPSPNPAVSGSETGGIVYERISDTQIGFAPVDPDLLDAQELTWPADMGNNKFYEYTHIDENRGQLLIYADNLELSAFMFHDEVGVDFDVFALEFTSDGVSVTDFQAVVTTWGPPGSDRYTTTLIGEPLIAGLTDDPRDLPIGWNGFNDGPGFIAPPTFDGLVMTMTEEGTGTEIQLANFIRLGVDSSLRDRTREFGTCAVIVTIDPDGPSPTVTTYSVNYTHDQIFGTENVEFAVEYVSGGGGALPADEVFTFTFLGGESLTSGTATIPVRTGVYVSTERPGGTFILDNRPAPST